MKSPRPLDDTGHEKAYRLPCECRLIRSGSGAVNWFTTSCTARSEMPRYRKAPALVALERLGQRGQIEVHGKRILKVPTKIHRSAKGARRGPQRVQPPAVDTDHLHVDPRRGGSRHPWQEVHWRIVHNNDRSLIREPLEHPARRGLPGSLL